MGIADPASSWQFRQLLPASRLRFPASNLYIQPLPFRQRSSPTLEPLVDRQPPALLRRQIRHQLRFFRRVTIRRSPWRWPICLPPPHQQGSAMLGFLARLGWLRGTSVRRSRLPVAPPRSAASRPPAAPRPGSRGPYRAAGSWCSSAPPAAAGARRTTGPAARRTPSAPSPPAAPSLRPAAPPARRRCRGPARGRLPRDARHRGQHDRRHQPPVSDLTAP